MTFDILSYSNSQRWHFQIEKWQLTKGKKEEYFTLHWLWSSLATAENTVINFQLSCIELGVVCIRMSCYTLTIQYFIFRISRFMFSWHLDYAWCSHIKFFVPCFILISSWDMVLSSWLVYYLYFIVTKSFIYLESLFLWWWWDW